MGIDISMRFPDGSAPAGHTIDDAPARTTEEFRANFCGANGYLRESYHGGPYATRVLVPEAFEARGFVAIPAGALRERLAETLLTVAQRYRSVYGEECDEGHEALRQFVEFVELAERAELAHGKPVSIEASY